eukprot:CAMPEP_0114524630 /NCGR_PEP_ID=MMETSP0109-20121206/21965_1 /TAXON_ID=29199 /ORGANISM="Chlorarachnion reptans, Strain CCCM449" /LENGTH=154 /DNA_ID=CAMNT_0001706101 /DNA_START=939 /DNA_END=1402 /DNA_ORIENTATION=+
MSLNRTLDRIAAQLVCGDIPRDLSESDSLWTNSLSEIVVFVLPSALLSLLSSSPTSLSESQLISTSLTADAMSAQESPAVRSVRADKDEGDRFCGSGAEDAGNGSDEGADADDPGVLATSKRPSKVVPQNLTSSFQPWHSGGNPEVKCVHSPRV